MCCKSHRRAQAGVLAGYLAAKAQTTQSAMGMTANAAPTYSRHGTYLRDEKDVKDPFGASKEVPRHDESPPAYSADALPALVVPQLPTTGSSILAAHLSDPRIAFDMQALSSALASYAQQGGCASMKGIKRAGKQLKNDVWMLEEERAGGRLGYRERKALKRELREARREVKGLLRQERGGY